MTAQRLVEKRRTLGKGIRNSGTRKKDGQSLSAREMVRKFKTEMDRMRSLVEKANHTEASLMIVVESFYNLMERKYKLIKDDRGQKNLVLQFTKNYLGRLLDNSHVERFLSQNYPDILEEFQKITDMVSLKTSDPKSS